MRNQGAVALGMLMALNPRPDPVLTELCNMCSTAEASPLRASVVDAMAQVLEKGGDKVTPAVFVKVASVLQICATDKDDSVRKSAAPCCGFYAKFAPVDSILEFCQELIGTVAITGVVSDVDVASVNSSVASGVACIAANVLSSLTQNSSSAASDGAARGEMDSRFLSVIDDLTELIAIGLQKTEGEGSIKIAVQM